MSTASAATPLERFLDPVGRCFTPEAASRLVKFRISREMQARLDELADKSTEGRLSAAEKAEYETYVSAIDFVTVLQSKARSMLAKSSKH